MSHRLRFVGRWRLYERIRDLVFEDVIEVDYVESESDLDSDDVILVDKVFENHVKSRRRTYRVLDELDEVELLAELADIVSSLLECREVVIGVDPGRDNSGVAIVHCQVPTLHALLPAHKIVRLAKMLLNKQICVSMCIGVSRKRSFEKQDVIMSLLASLSREIPVYVIDEESTKYRRSIYRVRGHRARRITPHELDAVIYALSIDEAIRVQI